MLSINAPKNSIVTLKYNEKEIEKLEMLEKTKIDTNINSNIGNEIIAECKLNDEVIYEKTFNLQKNNTINMYPCEENGDGKALYWYGMEFTEFNSGNVKYGNVVFELGECLKNENSINLNFNDVSNSSTVGIGLNCKQDLTNYNNIEFKIENITYTGHGFIYYYVSDIANDYKEDWGKDKWLLEKTTEGISNGVKNINISNENEEKYINIINFNPAGDNTGRQYGSISFDISTIVQK